MSYAARFRYLEDKNLIFDLQQYKKEDLPRPTKGKLATITEPNEIGELLCKIEESEARQTYPVALALQLAPYVMLRPGELVGGRWDEINFDKSEWYINAERMKPGFDHVVPLPRQAVELIKKRTISAEMESLCSPLPAVAEASTSLRNPGHGSQAYEIPIRRLHHARLPGKGKHHPEWQQDA